MFLQNPQVQPDLWRPRSLSDVLITLNTQLIIFALVVNGE
jgi:hypothetical protein